MIDYLKIAKAVEFYSDFRYIEVPWAITKEVMGVTLPTGRTLYPFEGNYLVASAEQSFLQMINDKKLNPGKYLAVTPCFRDDPLSETHQRYFVKVELINYTGDTVPTVHLLNEMVQKSFQFFQQYLNPKIVDTSTDGRFILGLSFDINSPENIELGSYGIRHHEDIGYWIYGTGVAEPRLSYAIELEEMIDRYTIPECEK